MSAKVHAAVDTLGHVLAVRVSVASDQDRAQVGVLAADVQAATGENVALAYLDLSRHRFPWTRDSEPESP